jgi:hypothetical protein
VFSRSSFAFTVLRVFVVVWVMRRMLMDEWRKKEKEIEKARIEKNSVVRLPWILEDAEKKKEKIALTVAVQSRERKLSFFIVTSLFIIYFNLSDLSRFKLRYLSNHLFQRLLFINLILIRHMFDYRLVKCENNLWAFILFLK